MRSFLSNAISKMGNLGRGKQTKRKNEKNILKQNLKGNNLKINIL